MIFAVIETRKCPKCGGQMGLGRVTGDFRIIKEGDLVGDRTSVIYCKRCGYVEFYKEASTKEPWRFSTRVPQPQPQAEPQQEPRQPEEEEPNRKPAKRLVR